MLGPEDLFYSKMKLLIDDIESGKKIAVVSYLVLVETIHVLRQRITQLNNFTDNFTEAKRVIGIEINSKVTMFLRIIRKLSEERKILIVNPKILLSDYHTELFKKMKEYFGRIRTMSICPYCRKGKVPRESNNECPSCHNNIDSNHEFQYKGLGHADIEHAMIAKSAKISTFYSSDNSFKDLNGKNAYSPINFEIIYPP